jgi:hypothetical protein
MALFSKTAKEWRAENPKLKGNIRDYANINELICLSNLENINALLINEGVVKSNRLIKILKYKNTLLYQNKQIGLRTIRPN